ncbi:MAG: thioredoxin-disulfide reductase [Acutalibacteraceae bacterium]
MNHIYDVIIVGGGPAGYTAALYASRAGLDTLLIEKFSAGGQMSLTGVIENFPGFDDGIDGFELGVKMQKCAERFGTKTESAEVLSLKLSDIIKTAETSVGIFSSKAVIIACGAVPKKLGLECEEKLTGRGVHYCAHCDGRFYKDKTVVVVGGGNSAAEDALYLSKLAKKVYLIHRRNTLRADKIYRDRLSELTNIEFIWNSTVSDILSDEKVTGAIIKNNETKKESTVICDGIFISIGRKPATDFLGNTLALDDDGYIIAGETTKTALAGVYAAGDVRTKKLRQIVTAVSDGATAAYFAQEYILNENN